MSIEVPYLLVRLFKGLIIHNVVGDPQYINQEKISSFRFHCIDNDDYITAKVNNSYDKIDDAIEIISKTRGKFVLSHDSVLWISIDQINNATITVVRLKETTKFEDIIIESIKPEHITYQKTYYNATFEMELRQIIQEAL